MNEQEESNLDVGARFFVGVIIAATLGLGAWLSLAIWALKVI